jgi:hypothetical protein
MAEGAVTSSASRWSRSGHPLPDLSIVRGTAGDCAGASLPTPLRDGLPCRPLPELHGLDRMPRPLRRAPRDRRANGTRRARPGAAPRPASDAQACRVPSSGRDGRSLRHAVSAGISSVIELAADALRARHVGRATLRLKSSSNAPAASAVIGKTSRFSDRTYTPAAAAFPCCSAPLA